MRLTRFTDYSFRVLLLCAANPDRLVTVAEISQTYKVSRGHIMKVVNTLVTHDFLQAVRGRSGGVRLNRNPKTLTLAEVIRTTEPDFNLFECLGGAGCLLKGICGLPDPFDQALDAFMGKLEKFTLADLMKSQPSMKRLQTA